MRCLWIPSVYRLFLSNMAVLECNYPGHGYDEPGDVGRPNDQPRGGYGKCRGEGQSASASFSTALCIDSASRPDEMTSGGLCAFVFVSFDSVRRPGDALSRQQGPRLPVMDKGRTMGVLLSYSQMGRWKLLGPTRAANVQARANLKYRASMRRRCTGGTPTSFPLGSTPSRTLHTRRQGAGVAVHTSGSAVR